MGIIPFQYLPGETAESLGLTGKEAITVDLPQNLQPRQTVTAKVLYFCGYSFKFPFQNNPNNIDPSCKQDISITSVLQIRRGSRDNLRIVFHIYPLAQQSCGGDIGSVPYVCM